METHLIKTMANLAMPKLPSVTEYLNERNKQKTALTVHNCDVKIAGINAIAGAAEIGIRAYVECNKLKTDRLNMQLQSKNIRTEQKEITKRFKHKCKNYRKEIDTLKQIALESNNPELVRAYGEALKNIKEE